jgi:hypothetical protein
MVRSRVGKPPSGLLTLPILVLVLMGGGLATGQCAEVGPCERTRPGGFFHSCERFRKLPPTNVSATAKPTRHDTTAWRGSFEKVRTVRTPLPSTSSRVIRLVPCPTSLSSPSPPPEGEGPGPSRPGGRSGPGHRKMPGAAPSPPRPQGRKVRARPGRVEKMVRTASAHARRCSEGLPSPLPRLPQGEELPASSIIRS